MLASDGVLDGDDVAVLDLYAGTGALAFEALSRGAATAILVEHGREALAIIQKNARALGAEKRIEVIGAKADRALARLEGAEPKFGLVLVDPPYAIAGDAAFVAVLAAAARLLREGGVLVLEHASTDDPPVVPNLAHDRSRTHGTTTLSLYRAANSR